MNELTCQRDATPDDLLAMYSEVFQTVSDAEFEEFMWRLEQEHLEAEHHTYSRWADVFVDDRGL